MLNKLNNLKQVFIICGYSWSGSSAMVDLLKEFKGVKAFETEFRLFIDPGGILELENSFLNVKSINSINNSIIRFKKLINALSRDNTWRFSFKQILSHFGLNYNRFMDNKFKKISEMYIKNLIEIDYRGALLSDLYELNYFEFLIFKMNYVIRKIIGKKGNKSRTIFYSNLNANIFYDLTRNYLSKLLDLISDNQKHQKIILDQAFLPSNYFNCIKYFSSPKIFVIDRDPRDIFTQASKLKNYSSIPTKDVEDFIRWFQITRKNSNNHKESEKNIFKIKFEDLICNYEKNLEEILDFIGENKKNHILKKKFLNPELSKNNIGIWKFHKDQSQIRRIENELLEYCWEV